MAMEIREAVPRDADAVYEMLAAQYLADYGAVPRTREQFEALWAKRDLAQTSLVLSDKAGQLIAYADWDEPPLEESWFSLHFSLAQEENPALIDFINAIENRIREQSVKTLITRITANHPHTMKSLSEQGYHNYLSFLIMQIDMDTPPTAAEWAEGITVRQFQLGQDEQATYLVDEGASKDKGYYTAMDYEKWCKRMNFNGEGFDPSLWFLACSGDEIVGVALNAYESKQNTAWVDHLGVSSNWRKKGIGMALLRHSFAAFYERGVKRVKLSVDAESKTNAHHLYENAGMSRVHSFHYFKKQLN
jgi:mycothiol synthase